MRSMVPSAGTAVSANSLLVAAVLTISTAFLVNRAAQAKALPVPSWRHADSLAPPAHCREITAHAQVSLGFLMLPLTI